MLTKYRLSTLIREIILVLIGIAVLIPFWILLVTAFKSPLEAASSSAVAPPTVFDPSGFVQAVSGSGNRNVLVAMLNSAVITAGSVILLILIGSIAAYTIARRPGRLGNAAYIGFVVGIILPFQLAMLPTYVALRSIGLLGSHVGMILLYTGLLMPLAVFLYTGFARVVPADYEEAASIDGASKFRIFVNIVFPLLAPATGTVAIMTGLIVWNDFFTPLIFLSGSKATTLPVMMYSFVGENATQWNVIFAVVILSMIPILTFYLFAQKKFIQGFAGGMKG
ncbi:carbohydrate ABC transporter permease [Microbacterium hydrothermale]|uniref:carbohydrate ABC transporter permease n=1 Tax=Microbacterium hydrothermale TaxID=857427 RepID=UPI0010A914BA|nr:carbohydrate ABC transporter permease [Microbacterium hydrothermale]